MFGARFDDVAAGSSFTLVGPLSTLVATSLDEVVPVIDAAAAASREGRWVAGYVTYTAAPAFDDALLAARDATVPLAWFGVFAGRRAIDPDDAPPAVGGTYSVSRWIPLVDRSIYDASFADVHDRIGAGDVYQVNLTFPMRAAFSGDPGALYDDLVAAQEAGYASHIWHDDTAIVSVSPERFFTIDGETIVTQPMKGTRPRGRWSEEDESHRIRLAASEKDRAENLMIVDLVRNDLGRVAEFGSVCVDSVFDIEKYRTVWQMSSQVSARLRRDVSTSDVFAALFPCGSVTGAPKTSAMEAIADVEPHARGVYCGAIGFIPPGDGRNGASFSVAIRTAVVNRTEGVVHYGVGGGITWGSDADGEYDEAMAKAAVLTTRTTAFGLIETLRWDGGWFWLDEHLDRLEQSSTFLSVPVDIRSVRAGLESLAGLLEAPSRVRLASDHEGSVTIEVSDLAGRFMTGPGPGAEPVTVEIDFDPVDESDVRLFHKTTDRTIYTTRVHRHPAVDDVILTNGTGMVTETTVGNVVCRFGDRWVTPPAGDGLLAGVFRNSLLADGSIVEESIPVASLVEADAVAVVNSVRGWRPAIVVNPR